MTVDAAVVDAPDIDAALDAAVDAPVDASIDGPQVGPCYTVGPGPNMLAPPPMISFAAPTIDLSSARGDSLFQAEGHMAASPVNGAALFAYISIANTGRTFIGTTRVAADGTGPLVQGTVNAPAANTTATDPALTYTADGVAHLVLMTLTRSVTGTVSDFHVSTTASSDDGMTWGPLVDVMGPDCAGVCDKPWIAAGRHPTNPAAQSLYITYGSSPSQAEGTGEHIVRSDDGGATWTTPTVIDAPVNGANLGMPVVAADGRVHVVWARVGFPTGEVYWATSADGGATFSAPRRIDRPADGAAFPQQVIVSASATALHVAYVGGPADGVWDVHVATSTDGGNTWSYRKANDEPSPCATHAWLAGVDTGRGSLALSWLDNRYGTGEAVFNLCPDNPVLPCLADELLSDATFPFTRARNTTQWLGDYGGLALAGTTIWATWSDPRNGVSSQRAARGTLP